MNRLVTWSLGNMLVVAPVSVPILVIVPRSGTERVLTPIPWYSTALPTNPFTPTRLRTSNTTSFAETMSGSFPTSSTPTTSGILNLNEWPAMAAATSRPPAPMASIPAPPAVGVWLSLPSNVFPGLLNLSRKTWWHIPFPGLEKYSPCFAAKD